MARTGNWPGITVDLMRARLIVGGDLVELVDLPGIYDLQGYSEDEQLVRTFLGSQKVDALVVVTNAVQLERQLYLVLQALSLEVPMLLIVNMQDEARQLSVHLDLDGLARLLETPVLAVSAKKGMGLQQIEPALASLLAGFVQRGQVIPDFSRIPGEHQIQQQMPALSALIHVPHLATRQFSETLDRWLLHPWFGLPLFFLILYLVFQGVYAVGAPVQEVLGSCMDWIKTAWLVPALSHLPVVLQAQGFVPGLLLDGVWGGLSTVAAFVPVIVLFFLFMALLEDTGYFSRAAYLIDALMERLGLDGRAFVMVLMGFGCNVPALMGTRVMRSRALRLLSMLIIPMSLCSARLQVFLFMTSVMFNPQQAPLVLFSLYVFSMLTAMLTALVFKKYFKATEPFVLEMPPYRLPTLRMMLLRAWHEVHHFLKRASTFITTGVVLVWLLTHLPWGVDPAGPHSLAGHLGHWAAPVMRPIGLNDALTVTLLFGFVAKEIVLGALAVIYHAQGHGLVTQVRHSMTALQAYSFMLFTLVYTPCLSTVVTLYQESRSRLYTVVAVAWPVMLAWLLSLAFYQGARWWMG